MKNLEIILMCYCLEIQAKSSTSTAPIFIEQVKHILPCFVISSTFYWYIGSVVRFDGGNPCSTLQSVLHSHPGNLLYI